MLLLAAHGVPLACAAVTRSATAVATKRSLLSAVAALRREPSVARRRGVLDAVARLEECQVGVSSPVDGRWALIFSTQVEPPRPGSEQEANILQPVIDATYALFFKVAPSLAGASPDGSSSSAANEQLVDVSNSGQVRNDVRIQLPFGRRLDITVNGEARVAASTASALTTSELKVTFSDCVFKLIDDEKAPVEGLRVPLPAPVGSLVTTHCDDDLRISRGGRGGIFVLRRLPNSQ